MDADNVSATGDGQRHRRITLDIPDLDRSAVCHDPGPAFDPMFAVPKEPNRRNVGRTRRPQGHQMGNHRLGQE